MKRTWLPCWVGMALVVFLASQAAAHEIVTKPAKNHVAAGESLPFQIHSSHVFVVSEELEDPADVKAFIVEGGQAKEVRVSANQKTLTYDGVATFSKPGAGMILTHRLPQVWSVTPNGVLKGTKKDLPGATKSTRYEKFSKTIVPVGGQATGFDTVVGQRLELVPLTDPTAAKPGQDIQFKVLLDGKPTPATVLATYDGFSKTPNTYAYYTETDDNNIATVKITQPGFWLVRTEIKSSLSGGDVDQEGLRAVLAFSVQ